MSIRNSCLLSALLMLGFGAAANAASVSLVPLTATDNLLPGATVSFEIAIDFFDEPTFGGGFDVIFDGSQLGFVGFTDYGLGDPGFFRSPDYIAPDLLQSWAIGDFNGLTVGTVGTVWFEVLSGATSSLVAVGPTAGIGGPWLSTATFMAFDPQPDYNSIQVNVVPVPATALLLGSALLGLAGVARRARR